MNPLFIFESTHHALWAEQVARDRGFPAEVVPAPSAARAKCGLALETLPEMVDALAAALDADGVRYERFSES